MKIIKALLIFFIIYSKLTLADEILGLPPVLVPEDNPQSPEKIALGQRLFEDNCFSADGTVSCSSCHQKARAFTDGLRVAQGITGLEGTRNAPTVVNAAFYTSLFLDGRRDSLETQAGDPFLNPIEHGLPSHQVIVDLIRRDNVYVGQFMQAFGINPDAISIEHVVKAIASYERTLVSGNSPFDRYFFGEDKTAMSKAAVRGLNVFRRKGNCANCHEITWNQALFTDNRFYNLGVGFGRINEKVTEFIETVKRSPTSLSATVNAFFNQQQRSELGRFLVTRVVSDIGKFRTPTLRNIERTGPYMHDGSQKTLEDVVAYYDKGGNKNPFLDPAIFPLKLSDQEKADLVSFLKALTSPEVARLH